MADLSIHDVERSARIRAVTDNLYFWQGLRFVSVGPALLLAAAFSGVEDWDQWYFFATVAAAASVFMWATARIERHYRDQFGHVRPRSGAHRTRARLTLLVAYPLMFGSILLDKMVGLPILVSGFVWALAAVLYRQSTGGGREHYLMLAAALVALGFAPLMSGVTNAEASEHLMLLVGFGMLAASWLDDREMRRVLLAGR